MCNTCTSMCIKLSLKKQHVNKIHFGVFGFMSCFVQIYMTNTADTKKLSGRVRDVLRQSWASHSLNSASKQTNISTYHQFNNAQNYQWTDFVHYCDFIYSQSRRIQARVIYNLSIRLSSKPTRSRKRWYFCTTSGGTSKNLELKGKFLEYLRQLS